MQLYTYVVYKINFLNLAVNKQDMASQIFSHTFPMVGNILTDKLHTTTIVYFL